MKLEVGMLFRYKYAEPEQLIMRYGIVKERIDEQKVEVVWLHNGLTHELFEQDSKSMVSSGGPGMVFLQSIVESGLNKE